MTDSDGWLAEGGGWLLMALTISHGANEGWWLWWRTSAGG